MTDTCACDCGGAKASVSRRNLLAGAGAVGAAGVLAACGASGVDAEAVESKVAEAKSNVASASSKAAEAVSDLVTLGKASDVPVGGAKLFKGKVPVVVAQPTSGNFVAYTAVCPHQGCLVADGLTDGKIMCPCHGSAFDPTNGSVVAGPAKRGLATVPVKVDGADLKMGSA